MSDDFFKKRRVLPPDYPQQARERIKKFFGWTDAETGRRVQEDATSR